MPLMSGQNKLTAAQESEYYRLQDAKLDTAREMTDEPLDIDGRLPDSPVVWAARRDREKARRASHR